MNLKKIALLSVSLLCLQCFPANGEWPTDEFGCTEIGCSDRLEITIERMDGESFASGSYSFVFTPSGSSTITLQCTLSAGGEVDCSGDTGNVQLEAQGGAEQFVATLHFAPQSVDVEVEHDGILLGAEMLYPEYTIVTPNGPNCDPMCLQASVVVEVSGW